MANQRPDQMEQPWYQRPWAIILALIIFAPVGLFLMWRYRPWSVRARWVVTAIVAALWILAGVAGAVGDTDEDEGSNEQTLERQESTDTPEPTDTPEITSTPEATETPEPTDTPEPTETPEPTDTPEPTPRPGWNEGSPVTESAARDALEDADELIRSVNLGEIREIRVISGDLPEIHVMVTYKAESALGETDLLTVAAHTTYSAMRALFANSNVTLVTVTILADWVDLYGQTNEERTTWARLSGQTVESRINWDGLEIRVIGDNKVMFCVADESFIHPGIYSRLEDRGCLLLR